MLKRLAWITAVLLAPWALFAQEAPALTPQEAAIAEAIKAQNRQHTHEPIQLPEATKAQALKELGEFKPGERLQEEPAETEEEADEDGPSKRELKKCLTVAFIDIDEAFDKHPRTQAVKEHIHLKIVAKEQEVQSAKELISMLEEENRMLNRQLRELKPFYERIVVEPMELLPKIEEPADSVELGNTLNRLLFAGAEILSTSPLNTPAQLDDITGRIATNKQIIAERSFFIDNYKYTTREEILLLEEKEVKDILQDIYTEIKSFAKKRNVGAIVRKDEILYGEKPVNVTKDFISRLKKSKKYRKK